MATARLTFEGITDLYDLRKAANMADAYGFPLDATVESVLSNTGGARFQIIAELNLLLWPPLDEDDTDDQEAPA